MIENSDKIFKKKKQKRSDKPVYSEAWEEVHTIGTSFKDEYSDASREVKLKKLIELSKYHTIFNQHSNHSYEKLRRKKHRTHQICFVCNDRKGSCKHHIIQLSHGGINHHSNLIPICKRCHEEIHPWLSDEKIDYNPNKDKSYDRKLLKPKSELHEYYALRKANKAQKKIDRQKEAERLGFTYDKLNKKWVGTLNKEALHNDIIINTNG